MQYQGQILDGQMHGCGKLTYENGEYYDGDWIRGISYLLQFLCLFNIIIMLYLLFNIIMLDKFDFILTPTCYYDGSYGSDAEHVMTFIISVYLLHLFP